MAGDKNFKYPMLDGWSTQDIITMSNLYTAVANAYEGGVNRDELLLAYDQFKQVVPSKAEEKQLDRAFGSESSYSIYRTITTARNAQTKRVIMEG